MQLRFHDDEQPDFGALLLNPKSDDMQFRFHDDEQPDFGALLLNPKSDNMQLRFHEMSSLSSAPFLLRFVYRCSLNPNRMTCNYDSTMMSKIGRHAITIPR
jgi:hypothetical protein